MYVWRQHSGRRRGQKTDEYQEPVYILDKTFVGFSTQQNQLLVLWRLLEVRSICLWLIIYMRVIRFHYMLFCHPHKAYETSAAFAASPFTERTREAQLLAWGGRARNWLSWDLNPGLSDAKTCVVMQLKWTIAFNTCETSCFLTLRVIAFCFLLFIRGGWGKR